MAKKKKSEVTRLEEGDQTLYSTFCGAANVLSLIYTQAIAQQKLAFQSGERHSMEKLYQMILRHNERGSLVSVSDIISYLQNEVGCGREDAPVSPSPQLPHQYSQSLVQFIHTGIQNSEAVGPTAVGNASRIENCNEITNTLSSNVSSSQDLRSLEPYRIAQGGINPDGFLPQHNSTRSHESNIRNQNHIAHSFIHTDSSVDMHLDTRHMDHINDSA